MTAEFEEAEAADALAAERDQCVRDVLQFMAACGVRVTAPPPQLVELLTAYGLHAVGIGKALAHRKRTVPFAHVDSAASPLAGEREVSGVLGSPAAEDARPSDIRELEREPTRRIVRSTIRK